MANETMVATFEVIDGKVSNLAFENPEDGRYRLIVKELANDIVTRWGNGRYVVTYSQTLQYVIRKLNEEV